MRVAGWIFVMLGFGLGFVLGFGVPLAEALPAFAPGGAPGAAAGGVGGWFQARPPWVGPMLLGVGLLTVSGWMHRDPDQA